MDARRPSVPHRCIRPTCGASEEAALRYDYAERTVWLSPPDPEPVPGVWPLCGTHADGLKVPEGWRLVDERHPSGLSYFPPLAV